MRFSIVWTDGIDFSMTQVGNCHPWVAGPLCCPISPPPQISPFACCSICLVTIARDGGGQVFDFTLILLFSVFVFVGFHPLSKASRVAQQRPGGAHLPPALHAHVSVVLSSDRLWLSLQPANVPHPEFVFKSSMPQVVPPSFLFHNSAVDFSRYLLGSHLLPTMPVHWGRFDAGWVCGGVWVSPP